jgi:hypothetical protein
MKNNQMTNTKAPHIINAHAAAKVKVRADGAVEISKVVLEEAGLIDVEVDVITHPRSITIVAAGYGGYYDGGDRLVREGFRVARSTLAKSSLAGLKALTIAAFNGKVVISK